MTSTVYQPKYQFNFTAHSHHRMELWRVCDGSRVGHELTHTQSITFAVFSPDSTYCLTGSADNSLKLWEADTSKITQVRASGKARADNIHAINGYVLT